MTKVYSSASKNGLRVCVGPEIMKRKVKNCAAVLRPLDVPSTLWKYGRVLSHSAVLCVTKKEYILIEYTSTNLVHVNLIGGFKNKESEIGPYFEYRGFIFHYMSPIQQPKKTITINDIALKMADYMCKKPYDVFTNNCHQARYLTMKHYGMKSHDPYNIKHNILFQGVADYFTNYDYIRVKKNLNYNFEFDNYRSETDSTQNSILDGDFVNKMLKDKKSKNNDKKSKSNKISKKNKSIRCSSTHDISKLAKQPENSGNQLFSHDLHLGNDRCNYSDYNSSCCFRNFIKLSESFSSLSAKSSDNEFKFNHIQAVKKIKPLRKCKSNTIIPKIKNPYYNNEKHSDSSDHSYLSGSTDSSSHQKQALKTSFSIKSKHDKKTGSYNNKKIKFFKTKSNKINYSASEKNPKIKEF